MSADSLLEGLWLDDHVPETERWVPVFVRAGLRPHVVGQCDEVTRLLDAAPAFYTYVLMDLDMPDVDGIEAYERIRRVAPGVPIIIVSGHLGEPVWDSRLRALPERLQTVAKPIPLEMHPSFRVLVQSIADQARVFSAKHARSARAGGFSPATEEQLPDPVRHLSAVAKHALEGRSVRAYLLDRNVADLRALAAEHQDLLSHYTDTAIRLLRRLE